MYEEKRAKFEIQPWDVLLVRRGRYRIGNVAIVTPEDTRIVVMAELSIFRFQHPENPYGLDPFTLLFLLSHPFVQRQMNNKIFVETTLQNLADRWRELVLPVPKSPDMLTEISTKVRSIIEQRRAALAEIRQLRKKGYPALNTMGTVYDNDQARIQRTF